MEASINEVATAAAGQTQQVLALQCHGLKFASF